MTADSSTVFGTDDPVGIDWANGRPSPVTQLGNWMTVILSKFDISPLNFAGRSQLRLILVDSRPFLKCLVGMALTV